MHYVIFLVDVCCNHGGVGDKGKCEHGRCKEGPYHKEKGECVCDHGYKLGDDYDCSGKLLFI